MLVERCFVVFSVPFFIVFAEPEFKAVNDVTDGLVTLGFSSVEGVAAAACTVGMNNRKTLVASACEKRCLAES